MALYDVSTSEKKASPELVSGGTLYADAPIGTIIPFGGSSDKIASGYLLCDGSAVSRTTYAELFAVIGTSFGAGDGSTIFNLPDLRGEFLRGAGTNSHTNQGNGGAVGEHQDATVFTPSRGGDALVDAYNLGSNKGFINSDVEYQKSLVGYSRVTAQQYTGGTAPAMVPRPTNTSVNYIIKAKQTGVPADFVQSMGEFEKYSTNEVLTNKTWIDGKPIYRKVLKADSQVTITTSWKNVSGITDVFNSIKSNIEMISEARFFAEGSTSLNRLEFRDDNGQLQIMISAASSITFHQLALVIEYTKTTD